MTSLLFSLLLLTVSLATFTIKDVKWSNDNSELALFKKLINTNTNESALISYIPGGRIEELILYSQQHNKLYSILSGHNGNVTSLLNDKGYKSNPLMPWANRIANATYNFFGK